LAEDIRFSFSRRTLLHGVCYGIDIAMRTFSFAVEEANVGRTFLEERTVQV
jgi:hypothetical protein